MISQTAEYALRAAVFLAQHPDEPCALPLIAEATHVPRQYLAKVMQDLARHGVVLSRRGVHGGYQLARPASEVTLLEIVQAVEPLRRIEKCPLGLAAHCKQLCSLHARLDAACVAFAHTLGDATLGQLLEESRRPASAGGSPMPLG